MDLRHETIGGVDCVVEVDSTGRFAVRPITGEDERGGAIASFCSTLDEAITKAKRELGKRKVKLDIPFIAQDGAHGVATGRHSGTGYVLARIGGESMQLSGYQDRLVFPGDVDPEVVERYGQAQADKRDAEQRIAAIKSEQMIDLDKVVEAAIDEHVRRTEEAQLASAVDDPRRD